MTKYIDSKTFEIIDNLNFFDVDDEIAEAIVILNKKGYRTIYSCAGHNKSGCLMKTQEEPIEFYEEWIQKYGDDITTNFIGKDNKYFYHKDEEIATYTYVSFDKKYDFEVLPDGFEIDDSGILFSIGKFCYYYNNNDTKFDFNRKSDFEIDNELKKTQNNLLDWSKKLKSIL